MSGLEGIPVERDPWLRARERQRLLFLALVDEGFDAAEMAELAERSCGMRLTFGTAARWLALAPNRPGWAKPLRAWAVSRIGFEEAERLAQRRRARELAAQGLPAKAIALRVSGMGAPVTAHTVAAWTKGERGRSHGGGR